MMDPKSEKRGEPEPAEESAEAGQVVPSEVEAHAEPDAEVLAGALQKKLKEVKKTAGFCGLCCGILRGFTSHASRRSACKKHVNSRKLTEQECGTVKAEVEDEFANPSSAR